MQAHKRPLTHVHAAVKPVGVNTRELHIMLCCELTVTACTHITELPAYRWHNSEGSTTTSVVVVCHVTAHRNPKVVRLVTALQLMYTDRMGSMLLELQLHTASAPHTTRGQLCAITHPKITVAYKQM